MARDGNGWRRVVASPRPMQILEARVIELVDSQASPSFAPAAAAYLSLGAQ